MRFYSLIDAPLSRGDVICRSSPLKAAIPVAIFAAITLAMTWIAWTGGLHGKNVNLPPAAAWWAAASTGLFCLLTAVGLSKSLHHENWLVRITATGLLIKYRSFMNRKLAATDTQVVAIEFAEVAWVREAQEVLYAFRDLNSTNCRTRLHTSYLDIQLADADTADLEERLRTERAGEGGSQMRYLDYPVTVVEGGVLRVRWKAMTPGLHHALRLLRRSVAVAENTSSVIDFVNLHACTSAEKTAAIRKLIENGHTFEAARSAEVLLGYSQSEAINFVRRIDERSTDSAES